MGDAELRALYLAIAEKLLYSLQARALEWSIIRYHTGHIEIYHWGKLVYTHQPQTTA